MNAQWVKSSYAKVLTLVLTLGLSTSWA